MKKVYIVNDESRAAVYGIGTYIRQIRKSLQDCSDLSLNVIVLYSKKKEFTIEKEEGCTMYYIPNCYSLTITLERYLRNIYFLLISHIQILPEDELIFHLNYTYEYLLIDRMKQHSPNCKVIFTIHYQDWCFKLNGNTTFLKKIIEMETKISDGNEKRNIIDEVNKERSLYQSVDRVICLSGFTDRILSDIYQISENKKSLLYNGIQDEYTSLSVEEKKHLKQQLFLPENNKIILYVGRLDEIKGLHILLEAFKKVVDIYPDCHLVVAGSGDFSRYLENSAPYWSKITFTGFIKKEELYKFYQIADVGVMLSMHEQCSYVAIEMMMFGLPVISTDTTGLNEMFPDTKMKLKVHHQGHVVSISPEECCETILLSLNAAKMIQPDNRRLFLERYTLERMRYNLLTIYNSL